MQEALNYADVLNSSILLWGNGKCGIDFLKVAKEIKLNVKGFIDGLADESYYMDTGEMVFAVKDLAMGTDTIIIITSTHHKDIVDRIEKYHITGRYLLCDEVFQLIAENYVACLRFKNREYLYGEYKGFFQYRYYIPKQSKELPLVIVLHGAGSRLDDNESHVLVSNPLIAALNLYQNQVPFAVLAPQCPRFRQWVEVPWDKGNFDIKACGVQFADYVMCLVEEFSRSQKVVFSKIYVIGHSIGGYGTWYLCEKYSDKIAAVVPVAGGGDADSAKYIMDMPIWAFHSNDDRVVPVKGTDRMAEALTANPHFRYTRYSNKGHDIFFEIFSDKDSSFQVLDWLFGC